MSSPLPDSPALSIDECLSPPSWKPVSSHEHFLHQTVKLTTSSVFHNSIQILSSSLNDQIPLATSSFQPGSHIQQWRQLLDQHHKLSTPTSSESLPRSQSSRLWTDLFRPTSFSSLLSDSSLNRQVLQWLKSWSFDYQTNPTSKPEQPFLLLTGPPGLGKTTLASVCAKTIGFKPIVINSSLERTEKTFFEPIEAANSSRSISFNQETSSGSNSNEITCLVLDELDGLTFNDLKGGPISKLISMAKSKKINRPTICICNDLYAPVLKNFKKYCFVLHVNQPTNQRLISRLQYICANQQLNYDNSALSKLVSKCDGDIRRTITSIQLIAGSGEKIDMEGVNNSLSEVDEKASLRVMLNFCLQMKVREFYGQILNILMFSTNLMILENLQLSLILLSTIQLQLFLIL
ncbi:hypothetical protein GEMRC1_012716 [Eukaryota sp. GEM-RC1]